MKILLLAFASLSFLAGWAQTPTKADVEKAVTGSWDKPATSSSPRQAATIHSIKIGSSAKANEQDRIDGIPPGATVTICQVDFTVREYFSDRTIATHRTMIAKVFKDQFGEWAAKSNGMKTVDTKFEPAN